MLLQKAVRFLDVIANQLRWKWKFNQFGWKSRLRGCDMLTNPKMISIGERVSIRKGARLEALGSFNADTPKLIIGDGTSIQFYVHCGAAKSVTIGKDVVIAGNVYITDHDHVFDDPLMSVRKCTELVSRPVVIGDGCWLGEGSMVLKGVTIGARSIVGANSVVTRDVPSGVVVTGVPAKVIRELDIKQHASKVSSNE